MTTAPRAFVFDFDGTLIDTEAVELASLQAMWARHGLSLQVDRWTAHLGRESPDWMSILASEVSTRVDRTCLRVALEADQRSRTARQPLRCGVRRIIDAARQHDIPLGIATNAERSRVDTALADKGLTAYFDAVVTRDDVVEAKPAPHAYLLACEQLAATPTECIAFEDSQPGLLAATAAGLRAVAVPTPHTQAQDFSAANLVVHELHELSTPDLLAGRLRTVATPQVIAEGTPRGEGC